MRRGKRVEAAQLRPSPRIESSEAEPRLVRLAGVVDLVCFLTLLRSAATVAVRVQTTL